MFETIVHFDDVQIEETAAASRFFWQHAIGAIESKFPLYVDRIAAGYFQNANGLQFYLQNSDFEQIAEPVQQLLDSLTESKHNCGVRSLDVFASGNRWTETPEEYLNSLSSGTIFYDPLGELTKLRTEISSYYPDQVWLKRLSDALQSCSAYGERLLADSLDRQDFYTAEMAWWMFSESVMRVGFLINRRFAPGVGNLYRDFCSLPVLSAEVSDLLWSGQREATRRIDLMRKISSLYKDVLLHLNLCQSESNTFHELSVDSSKSITDHHSA